MPIVQADRLTDATWDRLRVSAGEYKLAAELHLA
jgi:hypothetical protein